MDPIDDKNAKPINDLGVVVDARLYVAHFFKKSGLTVAQADQNPVLFQTLCLDYNDAYSVYRAKKKKKALKAVSDKALENAFKEYKFEQRKKELQAYTDRIKTTGDDLTLVRTWVKAVTGREHQMDVDVIAHWIWQVKRKAFNMPVVHHLMPVVYGQQGGGKSTAINQLLEVIDNLRMDISMSQIGSDKMAKPFSENLVVFFDELQGMARTDMESLKHQITTPKNSYRPLYQDEVVHVPMRCSFIGATNKHMEEQIFDSTGMRRFYEILAQPHMDREAINTIDYLALWRGVDENRERGYMIGTALEDLVKHQASYVATDPLKEFLSQYEAMPQPLGKTKVVTNAVAFHCFEVFCKSNNYPFSTNSGIFTKRMKNAGIKTQMGNRRVLDFIVSDECTMSDKPLKLVKES